MSEPSTSDHPASEPSTSDHPTSKPSTSGLPTSKPTTSGLATSELAKSEIVIARYNEDLDWVGDIPAGFHVIIYNKGPEITAKRALDRANAVVTLANSGREGDTFLRHILGKTSFGNGYTVFLQGDPFEHSPDAVGLLRTSRHWQDVQPLSWCWIRSKNLPPSEILTAETSGFIDGSRVRAELFSIFSWEPVQFFDKGAKVVGDWYRFIHDLPEGACIAAHFLRRCEWPELAEQAERHLVGHFAYGAMFAARQDILARIPRRSLELALEAANANRVYGYIIERMWLHWCGVPFQLPARDAAPPHGYNATQHATRFAPPETKPPIHRRVVPALKRRIGEWAQN